MTCCMTIHAPPLYVTPFQPGSRAVVDAGMKAVSMDSGVPLVSDSGGCWDEGSQHGLWCTFGK